MVKNKKIKERKHRLRERERKILVQIGLCFSVLFILIVIVVGNIMTMAAFSTAITLMVLRNTRTTVL